MGLFWSVFGIITIVGSWFNWNWLFRGPWKYIDMVERLGRNGARIYMATVGLALFAFGLLILFGVISF
jgi:hypothetical protein